MTKSLIGKEIWKDVPSHPRLMASSWGRVMRKPFEAAMPRGGTRTYGGTPTYGYEEKNASGRPGVPKRRIFTYCSINNEGGWENRKPTNTKVHRLVCEAFHGVAPEDKPVVLHINEDPSDNRPENLKWSTMKENMNCEKWLEYCHSRTGENSPITKHRRKQESVPRET